MRSDHSKERQTLNYWVIAVIPYNRAIFIDMSIK